MSIDESGPATHLSTRGYYQCRHVFIAQGIAQLVCCPSGVILVEDMLEPLDTDVSSDRGMDEPSMKMSKWGNPSFLCDSGNGATIENKQSMVNKQA